MGTNAQSTDLVPIEMQKIGYRPDEASGVVRIRIKRGSGHPSHRFPARALQLTQIRRSVPPWGDRVIATLPHISARSRYAAGARARIATPRQEGGEV